MDVLIIGAGAIGSLIAHQLCAAGHKVTAVARAPYVRAVKKRGLLLEQDGQTERAAGLRVVEHTDALGDVRFDVVLITTKAFDTAVAAGQASPFVARGAWAVIVQNGVGSVEIARTILGERNLYAGTITIPVEVLEPAIIRPRWGRGGIGVAPVRAGQDVALLAQLFAESRFEVRVYTDWQAMRWSKLMLNMLANAIPAILDLPVDEVYADRRMYRLERAAMREARVVVARLGIRLVSLPGYPVPFLAWMLCAWPGVLTYPIYRRAVLGGRGGKLPSLHIDLRRGRDRSEVAFLNGAVAQAGEKLGLPTPVNRMLCETLTHIVRGEVSWSAYRGQAERLL